MKEIPLYGGPSLQAAKANPGTAANAANGDQGQMLGASIHKAEQGLQGSAEAFSRISDFGEMQRQEVELRRIRDESDAEFSKLLSYAPGSRDGIFDSDGSIRKGKLDDLAYKFGQRIENLGGTFFNPESAIKARGTMDAVKASLPERYWGLAAKHQLSVARQAFDTNLKLAEEKEDWGGYENSIYDAVASGTISGDEGELLRVKGSKVRYEKQQENLKTALFSSVAADPVHAASSVNKGLYNDLNPLDLDRAKREIRRRLADIATPAPLTAEDRRNIQEKNIDALKKQLPNGATEQMWKWARNAQKNGGRITEQDKVEIRGAFSMELDKLPVPKDRDEARQIATRIIQKWSKLGAYDGNEEYIRAVVMDKLPGWMNPTETEGMTSGWCCAIFRTGSISRIGPHLLRMRTRKATERRFRRRRLPEIWWKARLRNMSASRWHIGENGILKRAFMMTGCRFSCLPPRRPRI